jgi:hypothetical protein
VHYLTNHFSDLTRCLCRKLRSGTSVSDRHVQMGKSAKLVWAFWSDLVWVTVEMPVTQHPPYRSRRALLTHRAPPSGSSVKAG